MELIRGLHNLRDRHRGCVATIGNFDGVHQGHRKVLAQVKAKAAELGLPGVVIIFEPQPREFFGGAEVPPRLTRFDEKVRLLEAEGIDRVVCLTFNSRLRSMSAEAFIDELLLQGLAVQHFVVGDDFRFGCDRRGDFDMLCAAGKRHGFSVEGTTTYQLAGDRVSSTRIRTALQQNDFELAAALLGWRYAVTGRVMHGQKLGRQLGVPTANVRMHRYACPLRGVFAVRAEIDGQCLPGVCNVGIRPTVNGRQPVLEVHLLDYQGEELYGRLMRVEFLHFVRNERAFDGIDALKAQIETDIDHVRAWFDQTAQD
ncbi:bifunctional riboflavin kinase/FAD synthetase [Marinobacterium marinum]|uniref:Riboflavin biosynthesis protein n=1 Tax=Marinobacterium marinum TaxID=2756129 RepID=A0A7W2AAK6_9GAMM|nr:bifunctional riboflavin kinase/FAD synthetase [Marinobacterium marinum]MBA4501120.1 bifunctional riboflavin kinase/FAD synthetase [Marinobacterium marinum]